MTVSPSYHATTSPTLKDWEANAPWLTPTDGAPTSNDRGGSVVCRTCTRDVMGCDGSDGVFDLGNMNGQEKWGHGWVVSRYFLRYGVV